jgi:hypothetical protein
VAEGRGGFLDLTTSFKGDVSMKSMWLNWGYNNTYKVFKTLQEPEMRYRALTCKVFFNLVGFQ